MRIQPAGDLVAFLVHGQVLVAAAGTDDHGGAGASSLGHEVGRERGLVLVLSAERARSAVRPQEIGFRGIGSLGEEGARQENATDRKSRHRILRYHCAAEN